MHHIVQKSTVPTAKPGKLCVEAKFVKNCLYYMNSNFIYFVSGTSQTEIRE